MKREGWVGSEVQPAVPHSSVSVGSGQKGSKQEHLSPADFVLGALRCPQPQVSSVTL